MEIFIINYLFILLHGTNNHPHRSHNVVPSSTTLTTTNADKKCFVFKRVDTVEAEDAYVGGRRPRPKRRLVDYEAAAAKADEKEEFQEIARFRSSNLCGVATR